MLRIFVSLCILGSVVGYSGIPQVLRKIVQRSVVGRPTHSISKTALSLADTIVSPFDSSSGANGSKEDLDLVSYRRHHIFFSDDCHIRGLG